MGTRELDATAADFLAALVSADVQTTIAPDEFTINDYIAEYERQTGKKISRSTAGSRLVSRVKSGALTRRMVRLNGRDTWAYKEADGTKPD